VCQIGLAASAVTFLKVQMRAWLNNLVTLVTDAGSLPRSTLTRGPLQVVISLSIRSIRTHTHTLTYRLLLISYRNNNKHNVLISVPTLMRICYYYLCFVLSYSDTLYPYLSIYLSIYLSRSLSIYLSLSLSIFFLDFVGRL